MTLLSLENISKSYTGFQLAPQDMQLEPGYIYGYVGKNGAGKTTTIKLIMRFIKADQGRITLMGKTYEEDPRHYLDQLAYVSDECYFPSKMKVSEVGGHFKRFFTGFDEGRYRNLLQAWNLDPKASIQHLSRGMKTKVMLAGALSRSARLILLDEATSGLDPEAREVVLELLQESIVQGDRSVLFSTHILSDLESIADYIHLIDEGKTMLYDTKESLLEAFRLVKGGLEDLPAVEAKLIGLKWTPHGFEGLLPFAMATVLPERYSIETPGLEDLVLYHIKRQRGAEPCML